MSRAESGRALLRAFADAARMIGTGQARPARRVQSKTVPVPPDRPSTAVLPDPVPAGNALAAWELLQRRQREQLMLLARRLGQLLEDQ